MTFVLLLFLIICLYRTKPMMFNKDYIDRKRTTQINGVFVFLVLISHFSAYLPIPMPYSQVYADIQKMLGQLVVTTFLFYSGYGVMESIKKKGEVYTKGIPIKLLELILNFSIAISLFVIVGMLMGKQYELPNILLACVGWKSVGNSNWYLFVILLLYATTYLSFTLTKGNQKASLLFLFAFSLIAIAFLMEYQNGTRWYNTYLCYFAGMLYSYAKRPIESFVMKNWLNYLVSGIVLVVVFAYLHFNREYLPAYMLHGIVFCLLVTWLSMILHLNNPVLQWLGDHIFSIYILQRIPMNLGEYWGWHEQYGIWYFLFSLLVTILIAYVFDKALHLISQRIFRPLKMKTKELST